MPAALLALVLSIISSGWSLWTATTHPVVAVEYVTPHPVQVSYDHGKTWQLQQTAAYAYSEITAPGQCKMSFTDLFVSSAPESHPLGKSEYQWVRTIVLHEMGHCLGLPHSVDPHALMYAEPTASAPTASDLFDYHQTFTHRATIAGF